MTWEFRGGAQAVQCDHTTGRGEKGRTHTHSHTHTEKLYKSTDKDDLIYAHRRIHIHRRFQIDY